MAAQRKPNMKLILEDADLLKAKHTIDPLMLTDQQVRDVMDTLYREMWQGLSSDVSKRKMSSLQMENTYVRSLMDGSECGDYMALDLGGTNFRVLLARMKDGKCKSISRNYNVPTEKLHGPAKGVFDHLADSIHLFMKEEDLLDQKLPLGFTFSFPMIQESIKKGILVTWTKSFACSDGVGQDAVYMLEESLRTRHEVQVDVVAVLNDTTGTLMAGSFLDKDCQIGLIMGTGCNAAYVEKLENVEKWEGDTDGEPNQVVIDTECGAFGDNGSLDFTKTEFDIIIDQHSNHKGSFTFEKRFAGHYLGDIVRLVLLTLTEEGVLFKGHVSDKLRQWNSVPARHVSDVERDGDGDTKNTQVLLRDLDLEEYSSPSDVSVIRYICSAVSIRCAQLVCSTIAVLLNHMKQPTMTVAIDGSLYRYHPNLHDMMMAWIKELAPNTETKLILAEDGSGRGAAFVAASALKSKR